ncbi:hypothetical protein AB1Y20_003882 [Prymnesium parvum]|uniref:Uncharacterized protein n=1 Tax=Prymnesium parvum TaxID=97485 RepID=A0AB34J6G0_PRYPA
MLTAPAPAPVGPAPVIFGGRIWEVSPSVRGLPGAAELLVASSLKAEGKSRGAGWRRATVDAVPTLFLYISPCQHTLCPVRISVKLE